MVNFTHKYKKQKFLLVVVEVDIQLREKKIKKGKIKKGKKTSFDAMYSCANINKIKKKMKFSPKITLEEGIRNLLDE